MSDAVVEDLEDRIEMPSSDPMLPVTEDNTKNYYETLKRFVEDAKNAKDASLPGAKEFWELARLEILSDAIEEVEGAFNPVNRAITIGLAIGDAAMHSKPAVDRFLAERSANAVTGEGHANPDFAAASVHAVLGDSDWVTDPINKAIANFSFDDIKKSLMKSLHRIKYKFRRHDYLGCAEEAIAYFARAQRYYHQLRP